MTLIPATFTTNQQRKKNDCQLQLTMSGMDAPRKIPKQRASKDEAIEASSSSQQFADKEEMIPMLNPVVLERFFEVCHFEDLARFRLVCKAWYSVSLASCRREMSVKIHSLRKKEADWYQFTLKKWPRWKTLVVGDLEVDNKPFRSFVLSHLQFGSSSSTKAPIYKKMQEFWTRYGHTISKLELNHCVIFSMKAFKKAIFEDTPNLEELKFEFVSLKTCKESNDSSEDEKEGEVVSVQRKLKTVILQFSPPISWHLLFTHFPKIQRLELGTVWDTHFIHLEHTLATLSNTRTELCIRHLTLILATFSDFSCLPATTLRLFQLSLLKLATLRIDMSELEDKERSVLPAILRQHGVTLKDLQVRIRTSEYLRQNEPPLTPYDNFPFYSDIFTSLTNLKLRGQLSWDLHFLEQMPNLTKLAMLDFYEEIFNETDMTRMDKVRLPHLQELVFKGIHIPERGMEMLVKVMPNVVKLAANLLTPSFRVVCKHWRSLRKMYITSGFEYYEDQRCPDSDLQGIDDESITGILDGSEDLEDRLPNLTNLQFMEELQIWTTGGICDGSVWNGFLLLPKLRELGVRLTPETSEKALNALRPLCQEDSITRSDLDMSSESDDDGFGF